LGERIQIRTQGEKRPHPAKKKINTAVERRQEVQKNRLEVVAQLKEEGNATREKKWDRGRAIRPQIKN